jgi:hypothetical protein
VNAVPALLVQVVQVERVHNLLLFEEKLLHFSVEDGGHATDLLAVLSKDSQNCYQNFIRILLPLFFYACILRYYLLKPLTSLSCSLNAVFPGLKMWDTFALDCFDLKVRPGTPATNPGLHRQSDLKSPQTTCYCNFFIQLYSAIAVLATCPRAQGYKSHFSTLKVGLAGTGNRTQATCLAGSVARRSAIHYAFRYLYYQLGFIVKYVFEVETAFI